MYFFFLILYIEMYVIFDKYCQTILLELHDVEYIRWLSITGFK